MNQHSIRRTERKTSRNNFMLPRIRRKVKKKSCTLYLCQLIELNYANSMCRLQNHFYFLRSLHHTRSMWRSIATMKVHCYFVIEAKRNKQSNKKEWGETPYTSTQTTHSSFHRKYESTYRSEFTDISNRNRLHTHL